MRTSDSHGEMSPTRPGVDRHPEHNPTRLRSNGQHTYLRYFLKLVWSLVILLGRGNPFCPRSIDRPLDRL